jgi:hypothetical protein
MRNGCAELERLLAAVDVEALHRRACASNDAVRNFDTVLKGGYPSAESAVY